MFQNTAPPPPRAEFASKVQSLMCVFTAWSQDGGERDSPPPNAAEFLEKVTFCSVSSPAHQRVLANARPPPAPKGAEFSLINESVTFSETASPLTRIPAPD